MDERDLEAHIGVESERAFFAGFAGVALMIVWTRAAWLFGFPPLDSGTLLGSTYIGQILHTDTGAHFILGSTALVLLGALALAWLYAEIYPWIPGTTPLVRGIVFALGVWVVGQLITAPLLGSFSETPPGIFSMNLGTLGLIGGLIAHLLYGALLGTGYGHHVTSRQAARLRASGADAQ
jgi:MFS superfamily sulfate permease-like transporter